ncbi:MAG: hypothetical protein Q8P13_01110 [bacterium]|nr:hypothetical protein [bacterium]
MNTGNKLMGLGAFLFAIAVALTFAMGGEKVLTGNDVGFRVPLRPADPSIAESLPCKEDEGQLVVRPLNRLTGSLYKGLQATAVYGSEPLRGKTQDDGTIVFSGVPIGAQPAVIFESNELVWTGDRISEKHVPLQRSHEDCTAETAVYLVPLSDPKPTDYTTNIDQDGWGPQSAPAPLALLPGHEQQLVSSVPIAPDPSAEQFFMGLDPREQTRVTMNCNGFKVDANSDPKELIFDYDEAVSKGFISQLEAAGFDFEKGPGGKLLIKGSGYKVSVLLDAGSCDTRLAGGFSFSGEPASIVQLLDGTVAVLDDKCLNLITPTKPPEETPTPTNTQTKTVTPTGTVPATGTPTPTSSPTNTPSPTKTFTPTKTPVVKEFPSSTPKPPTSTPVPSATATPGCPGDCTPPPTIAPTKTLAPVTNTPAHPTNTPIPCDCHKTPTIPVPTPTDYPTEVPTPTPWIV